MKLLLSGCLLAASSAMLAGCHSAVLPQLWPPNRAGASRGEPAATRRLYSYAAQEPFTRGVSAIVSAQVVGRIQQVLVREGDNVRAGQTLAVLDDATQRAHCAPGSRPE